MATTLHVSPWEYSEIVKHAHDLVEAEFISWMLEKWPHLRDTRNPLTGVFEKIDVVVDWTDPTYVLVFRSR